MLSLMIGTLSERQGHVALTIGYLADNVMLSLMIGTLSERPGHAVTDDRYTFRDMVMFNSVLWWMLSSFVAQGAFLKVSAKQWILNSVRQLDVFCDLSFSESFLHLSHLWLGWCFPGV